MGSTPVQRAARACSLSLFCIAAFSACINALALASPLYMLQLYDRVLASRSVDTLIMLTLVVVAALGLLSLLDALRRIMLARMGAWLDARLGPSVLSSAVGVALLSGGWRAATASSDLAAVRGFLSGPAMMPLLDAPWSPLFLAVLFFLHPLLGTIGLAAALLLIGLAVLNELATRRPLRESSIASSRIQQSTQAILQNAEVVRAMGMLDGVMAGWLRQNSDAAHAQLTADRRGNLILAISRFSRLFVQTLIMGAGAWLVIRDNASAGLIFAGSFLLSRALAPIDNAISSWKSLTTARLAYRRLVALFQMAPMAARGMPLPPPKGHLSVEKLNFVPAGSDAAVLRSVSFMVPPGEVLAVVGPSAAGKSTLARLVAGTCLPTHGHVRLDGADIAVWHASGGSKHVGYLPQDIELFAGSIRHNIARFADVDPDTVVEAAKLVGLHETIMRLPQAYDSEIGDGGLRLSGGLRQRVGLARAVFGRPRLLILDEPNSSLDHEGEAALHRAIDELRRAGSTILIITHRPNLLNSADKLLLMRLGTIEDFGNRDAVAARVKAAFDASRQQDLPISSSKRQNHPCQ